MIKIIVATDKENGIGDKDGNLLFKIKEDMDYFVEKTTEVGVVVMGRKTWDSLPDKSKPLKNRKNIVLTKDTNFTVEDDNVVVVNDIQDVLDMSKDTDLFVIGGGEIYRQFIDHADELYVTHIHDVNEEAYVFFPEFSYLDWKIVSLVRGKNESPTINFAKYVKNKK